MRFTSSPDRRTVKLRSGCVCWWSARMSVPPSAATSGKRYQEGARRGLFVGELRSILESEVSWSVGQGRRTRGGNALSSRSLGRSRKARDSVVPGYGVRDCRRRQASEDQSFRTGRYRGAASHSTGAAQHLRLEQPAPATADRDGPRPERQPRRVLPQGNRPAHADRSR